MSMISEALRAEMQRILAEAKEFDIKTCVQLERAARAAKGMLAATGGAGLAMQTLKDQQEEMYGGDAPGMQSALTLTQGYQSVPMQPITGAPASETFGVRAIQEFIKVLPALIAKKNAGSQPVAKPADPLQLIRAIKEAKAEGFHEIAKVLEQRLLDENTFAEEPEPPTQPAEGELVGIADIPAASVPAGMPTPPAALAFGIPGVAPPPVAVGMGWTGVTGGTAGVAPPPTAGAPLTFGED